MKKIYTLIAFIVTITTFAQAPQGFNYQATVRNAAGALIVNQNVNFKFNLMQNSPTGVPVYSETHYVPTDDLGAVNLVIGQGTATTGIFNSINWGNGNYYLGIELNTGSGYIAMGTTQLLSVPYALYAGSSQNKGKPSITITGNITNAQAAAQIVAEFGPYTENVYIENTTGLTTVDLSMFTKVVDLNISNNANLISVNISNLIVIYNNFTIQTNPVLTSLQLSSLNSVPAYLGINLRYNAFPSTVVNSIINKMLTVNPISGKSIELYGQTPPAPPTGQGIIDKTILENTGNGVNTD